MVPVWSQLQERSRSDGRHTKFYESDERSSDFFLGAVHFFTAAVIETGEMIAPLLDAVFIRRRRAAKVIFVFGHPLDVSGGISTKDLSSNHFVVFVGR